MTIDLGGGKALQLIQGDITQIPVDAICNAANSELRGGGGVDGAIHQAGGPSILLELTQVRQDRGPCPPGSAVATAAGLLPAKYVFHAVGPIYRGGTEGEAETLASAYRACLSLAEENGVEYMSFPSISTGVFGYPVDEAAPIAVMEVVSHLRRDGTRLRRAVFVLYDDQTFSAYQLAAGVAGRKLE